MARQLTSSAAAMVAAAREEIEEINAADAITMALRDDVVMVDLRDVRERQRTGYVPGSFHCTRGMVEFWVDPESPYYKEIFERDATFVFYCASGWRSALTVKTLNDMGFDKAAHVKGGFSAWTEAGGPVESA